MKNSRISITFAILCILGIGTNNALVLPNFPAIRSSVYFQNNLISNESARAHLMQRIIPNYFPQTLLSSKGDPFILTDFENVTQHCRAHVGEWLSQLSNPLMAKLWAIQMVDAWGKFPEGILSGHTTVLGDFDECLAIRAELNVSTTDPGIPLTFKGKYCTNSFSFDFLPIPVKLGTCYPSTCTPEDVTILLEQLFHLVLLPIESDNSCYTDDKPKLTAGDIAMISVLGVLLSFCITGTVLDLVQRRRNPASFESECLVTKSFVAFSVYTNTMKWLNTKSSGDNLGSIHGIRFLSTCWVVLAHTFSLIPTQPTWNLMKIFNIHRESWLIFVIINGTVVVDTFFAMSGLLVAYGILKALDKTKGRLNVPMLYLHRYIRLTPLYAFLLGISATWFSYLRTGPNTAILEVTSRFCAKYWWHNILYINNLLTADGMCYGESWYLAVDMQFFIISPILIYPLWKWKLIGKGIMITVTIISAAIPTIVTYEYNLIPTPLPTISVDISNEYMTKNYIKPWMRIGPYLIGIWAGYFLYSHSKNKIQMPKLVAIVGWLVSTGIALAIIFGPQSFFEPGADISKIDSAFYAGLHRLGWGVVICWIIVACKMGYGGWINDFLSWKVFIPLGRLSFCVYLISYELQTLFHYSVRQAVSYDPYTTTNLFFSHIVMSYLVSFICCILMESPFIALEKIVFAEAKPNLKKTEQLTTQV